MNRAFRWGIAGGIWAVVIGFVSFILFVLPAGFALPQRFGWADVVIISVMLMGVLSLIAIAQRLKKPRLALALIWVSIVDISIAAWLLDIITWGLLVLPSALLLLPVAFEMRRTS